MNIEASFNKETPSGIIGTPQNSTELKRAVISDANLMTLTFHYKNGALVFEKGKDMANCPGRWIKVYYENKNGFKKQIGCLGEYYQSGGVSVIEGPEVFMINGVSISITDYYKSL